MGEWEIGRVGETRLRPRGLPEPGAAGKRLGFTPAYLYSHIPVDVYTQTHIYYTHTECCAGCAP